MVCRPRPSRYDNSIDSTPILSTRYRPATVPPSDPNIGGPWPSVSTAIFTFVFAWNEFLFALLVTGPDTRPVAFYNALTHAREPEGMQALFYFVDDLLSKYGSDPTATYLLDQRRIYICPVVNPDGYVYSWTTERFWRKNRRDNGECSEK